MTCRLLPILRQVFFVAGQVIIQNLSGGVDVSDDGVEQQALQRFFARAFHSRVDAELGSGGFALKQGGDVVSSFNTGFFTTGDSREAEQAGVGGALMGSFLTILTAILIIVGFQLFLIGMQGDMMASMHREIIRELHRKK